MAYYTHTYFAAMLSKLVIKYATSHSVAATYALTERLYLRSAYIVKVLRADRTIRNQVREIAKASSNSAGLKQLEAILTVYELLSPTKKTRFIDAFKTAASLHGGALPDVSLRNTWQPGHIPPYYTP